MDLLLVKTVHVLSSTFLFGTGVGTAYFLFFASRGGDARVVAAVARLVVVADWCFTATTMVVQPVTGLYLARAMGIPLTTPWLYWSIVLFIVAGLCWLPVVWLQMRLRDLAAGAAARGEPLPAGYAAHLGAWTALGIPALLAFLMVFYLMVARQTPW